MSADDRLDLFLITKNATIAPTTRMDITMPAMAPPPIPDLPPPSPPLPPLPEGLLLPPDLWCRLSLLPGGVPGGGGGAGPEFHELPFDLLQK